MKQPVQTAQVYENTEIGDILDNTLSQLTGLDLRENLLLAAATLILDQLATRYHNVAPFNLDLENLAIHLLTDKPTDITRPADINLRSRQKYRNAYINKQTALDAPHHSACNLVPLLLCRNDIFPCPDPVGFALAQKYKPTSRIRVFQQNFYFPASYYLSRLVKLVRVDYALAFKTNLDNHIIAYLRNDRPLQNCPGQTRIHFRTQCLFQELPVLLAEHLTNLFLQLLFGHPQFVNYISVYHKFTFLRGVCF